MGGPIKRLRRFVRDVVHNRLFWIIFLIVLVVLVAGRSILLFERTAAKDAFGTLGDGIWWAIVTMTTVGYGDRYPVTTVGRVIGVALMFSSMILISLLTATVSSILVARKIQEGRGLEAIKFEDHVLLCGWNARAPRILETLNDADAAIQVVMINEMAPEPMEALPPAYPNLDVRFIRGDFTREQILERANIRHASGTIVVPDRSEPSSTTTPDQRTILAAHVIRSINPEMKVFAHVLEEEHVLDLKRAEVDGVVLSDAYTGELLADYVVSPGTPQVMDRLLDDHTPPNIRRVRVPDRFVGRPSIEFFEHLKRAENRLLVGYVTETAGFGLEDAMSGGNREVLDLIMRKVQGAGVKTRSKGRVEVNINPPDDYTVREDDYAIVICSS